MGKYGKLIGRALRSVDYWAQIAMRHYVVEIDRRMQKQDISRAQLAERLNTTPAYVTKVMRGDVNFTLETMTKLALAVGGKLRIEVIDRGAQWRNADWVVSPPRQAAASQRTQIVDLGQKMQARPTKYQVVRLAA